MRMKAAVLALATLISSSVQALAADYYVAPVGTVAKCTPTGTKDCPFLSVSAAFSSRKIVGGDNIYLLDGEHGKLQFKGLLFDRPVTIQSLNGKAAHIESAHFDSTTSYITLKNLSVWRSDADTLTIFLIRSYAGAKYLAFEGLDMRSRKDAKDYLSWSKERWVAVATTGFTLSSSFNTVRGNTLTGVKLGIFVGPDSLVENNVIDGFAADGMNGASRTVFRGNIVKNVFGAFPEFHRDGFQAFSKGDPIVGLTIEGNKIIQWAHTTPHPLMGSLQGIGLFDGYYDNLVIRNNLVVTNHTHGITVMGTRGAEIINNTVLNLPGVKAIFPHIQVTKRKDGSPSTDVMLANNVAMSFAILPSTTYNIVARNNSAVLDPLKSFENPAALDFDPTAASGFVDTGDASVAPPTDVEGHPRPSGAGPDRGALESGSTAPTGGGTTDGGTTSGGTTGGGTTGDGTTTGDGSTTGGTTTGDGTTTGGSTDGGTTTGGGKGGGKKGPKFISVYVKDPSKD